MRDFIAAGMYIEALGCFAFAVSVLLALTLDWIRGQSRSIRVLVIGITVTLILYLISGGLWDAALAYHILDNPKPLPAREFVYFEFVLQVVQAGTIWLSIPLIFLARWIWGQNDMQDDVASIKHTVEEMQSDERTGRPAVETDQSEGKIHRHILQEEIADQDIRRGEDDRRRGEDDKRRAEDDRRREQEANSGN